VKEINVSDEKERLERELANAKESHRTDLFIIYWFIGLVIVVFIFGTDNFAYSIVGWLVVFLAWKLATKQVKK
jgi:hypothetical protein